jgi:hypothetical protein
MAVALCVNAGLVIALVLIKVSVRDEAHSTPVLSVVFVSPRPPEPADTARAGTSLSRSSATVTVPPPPIMEVPADLSPAPRVDWNEAAREVARAHSGSSPSRPAGAARPADREIWDRSVIERVTETPDGLAIALNERCSLLVGTVKGPSGLGTGMQAGCGVGQKETRDDLFDDLKNDRGESPTP